MKKLIFGFFFITLVLLSGCGKVEEINTNCIVEINEEYNADKIISLIEKENGYSSLKYENDQSIECFSTLGTEHISIIATKGFQKKKYNIDVEVVDTIPPQIKGVSEVIINETEYEKFDFLNDIFVEDNSGEIIIVSYTINKEYDGPGEYNVDYVAKDSSGNETVEHRKMVVKDSTGPIISGVSDIEVFDCDFTTIDDLLKNITAIDNVDKNINVDVLLDKEYTGIGEYTVTYTASDSSGNITKETASLCVKGVTDLVAEYVVKSMIVNNSFSSNMIVSAYGIYDSTPMWDKVNCKKGIVLRISNSGKEYTQYWEYPYSLLSGATNSSNADDCFWLITVGGNKDGELYLLHRNETPLVYDAFETISEMYSYNVNSYACQFYEGQASGLELVSYGDVAEVNSKIKSILGVS